jgi:hypothetical protein
MVRGAAVKRLNDQRLLAEIAGGDGNVDVRSAARERLKTGVATGDNQVVLAEIARSHAVAAVREAAIERLTDQDVLAAIARTDTDSSVRHAAVDCLSGQTVLSEIATADDQSWHVRIAAARKLNDETARARAFSACPWLRCAECGTPFEYGMKDRQTGKTYCEACGRSRF